MPALQGRLREQKHATGFQYADTLAQAAELTLPGSEVYQHSYDNHFVVGIGRLFQLHDIADPKFNGTD